MVMDDQNNLPHSAAPFAPNGNRYFTPRGKTFQVAAVALTVLSLSGMGFFMLHWLKPPEGSAGGASTSAPNRAERLFQEWPTDRKADLVLVLSGQQFGYLQPCGCSEPQYGGLERRFNFFQTLIKERGWPIAAVDLGDIAPVTGAKVAISGRQARLKYKYSMEALNRLGYTAVGIGQTEMSLPLFEGLTEFSLNNPKPRVLSANLVNKETNFPDMVESSILGGKGNEPKIGIVGVVAPSVSGLVRDPGVMFDPLEKALPPAIAQIKAQKPDIMVLLFQGTVEEAKALVPKFPQFQVILALSAEEEPSAEPKKVGKTIICNVGHKGRSLGLLGIYRTKDPQRPFELYYQLAHIGPEYKTPEGQDSSNPILALLEEYAKEVKRNNYLADYRQSAHPIQLDPAFQKATYVGSQKCKTCHKDAYKTWEASKHSQAFQSLVDATRPGLRQFDGECVRCHVTGFDFVSGYRDPQATPNLLNVGCESCHGPGSLHLNDKDNQALHALMNPFKAQPNENPQQKQRRMLAFEKSCTHCHDEDNDVNWNIKKWVDEKIVHMTGK